MGLWDQDGISQNLWYFLEHMTTHKWDYREKEEEDEKGGRGGKHLKTNEFTLPQRHTGKIYTEILHKRDHNNSFQVG